MRVAVVGAGPTGLTAAHLLAAAGDEVTVFEASPHVGGLARSLELWDRTVDLGAHIFATSDPRVLALWRHLAGEVRMLPLRRGIWTGTTLLPYPLRPLAVARSLGGRRTAHAGLDLVARRLRSRGRPVPPDAEGAVVSRYGRVLYSHLFRDYAEKLWGTAGDEIDAAFVSGLFEESDASRAGPPRFPYPVGGTGSVWNAMAAELLARGGELRLDTPVTSLLTEGDRVRGVLAAGREHPADLVVSTMPAALLLRALPAAPAPVAAAAAALRARSTVLVYLRLEGARAFDLNWAYVQPPALGVGRITCFDSWTGPAPDGSVAVSLEYWCDRGDARWSLPDHALVRLAADEVAATGLLGTPRITDGHVVRLGGTHPAHRLGDAARGALVRDHLAGWRGLRTTGRHGGHALPGVGACMESAWSLADAVHPGDPLPRTSAMS